jgi:hypothetical protein
VAPPGERDRQRDEHRERAADRVPKQDEERVDERGHEGRDDHRQSEPRREVNDHTGPAATSKRPVDWRKMNQH